MPVLTTIRKVITSGINRLEHCPTKWMIADILTSVQTRGEYYGYAVIALTKNGKQDEFLLDKSLPEWLRAHVRYLL